MEDAYRLATAYPEIKEINLGGKSKENTRNISKAINITPDEEKWLKNWSQMVVKLKFDKSQMTKSSSIKCLVERRNKNDRTSDSLGCIAFIAQSEYALGTSLLSRPIVTGLFVGIVLGDVKTGVIMGATLELAFIGFFQCASIPPDVVTGGILGTAFAITAGAGTETALVLGLPIATLTLILKIFIWVCSSQS